MDKEDLGRRLRALRTGRGLSLAQLEAETNVSSSFLSLVEQGRSDISVSRLMTLVRYFGIEFTDLLPPIEPAAADIVHYRSGEAPSLPGLGLDVQVLAPTAWALTPTVSIYVPGTVTVIDRDDMETLLYVLDGPFELTFTGDEPIRLERGDSVVYRGGRQYTMAYVGDGTGLLLGVSTAVPSP